MDVSDALKAMSCIDELFDGSPSSRDRAIRLTNELLERPEQFWDTYFDAASANDPIRIEAEALIRSGIVTDRTTFAELPAILAEQQ
jgi:hypothetical protein